MLAVFAALYGPVVGALAGFIGHLLIDATWGIWLSWELATLVFGLLIGLFVMGNRVREGDFGSKTLVRFNLSVIAAHAVAWLLVAPLGDILIYSEPTSSLHSRRFRLRVQLGGHLRARHTDSGHLRPYPHRFGLTAPGGLGQCPGRSLQSIT